MSPNVDVGRALALLPQLEPDLSDQVRALRAADPDLAEADVQDGALRAALARLRAEVSHETFMYLQWKAELAREAGLVTRAAAEAARAAALDTRMATAAARRRRAGPS